METTRVIPRSQSFSGDKLDKASTQSYPTLQKHKIIDMTSNKDKNLHDNLRLRHNLNCYTDKICDLKLIKIIL